LLDQGEFDSLKSLKKSLPTDPAGYASSGGEPVSQRAIMSLAEFLIQLDEKMDRVIGLLGGEKPDEVVKVKETLNISGSGIRMAVTAPVAVGQLLQISLGIPGLPLGMFKVVGEVVRTKARPGENVYDIGVNFVDITEADRDRLIACSFSQQRKIIRQSKEE
jgi:hypothetical protein